MCRVAHESMEIESIRKTTCIETTQMFIHRIAFMNSRQVARKDPSTTKTFAFANETANHGSWEQSLSILFAMFSSSVGFVVAQRVIVKTSSVARRKTSTCLCMNVWSAISFNSRLAPSCSPNERQNLHHIGRQTFVQQQYNDNEVNEHNHRHWHHQQWQQQRCHSEYND